MAPPGAAEGGEVTDFLGFDHVDSRVHSLPLVESFYDKLMPELGFAARKTFAYVDPQGEWNDPSDEHPYNTVEYYADRSLVNPPPFFGVIESPGMIPTATRIAFRVERAALETWLRRLPELGAHNVEPSWDMDEYPAIFFEDPAGTKLEVCARKRR